MADRPREMDSNISIKMTYSELARVFRNEAPRPSEVEGDPYGLDATTEDILRLIEADPDSLTAEDFSGYLGYCTTGGDDDLRFLLLPILRIWESELYNRDGWFTQYFHEEICRTDFLERALGSKAKEAVQRFMVRALSGRIGAEDSLSVEGMSGSHNWFGYLASFGVCTTAFPVLWTRIWESGRAGHATALLQYLSCLLYEGGNPVFAPWTCDKGGGAPELWGYDSVGFREAWKRGNLDFFSSALTSESIGKWLERAEAVHSGSRIAGFARRFLDHLAVSAWEVDERIGLLLTALRTPSHPGIVTWDSLRAAAGNAGR